MKFVAAEIFRMHARQDISSVVSGCKNWQYEISPSAISPTSILQSAISPRAISQTTKHFFIKHYVMLSETVFLKLFEK
jgi:hypothetical protein